MLADAVRLKNKTKNRLSVHALRRRKEEKAMYTEYGYIGEDGIEYATEQEAYEARTDKRVNNLIPCLRSELPAAAL